MVVIGGQMYGLRLSHDQERVLEAARKQPEGPQPEPEESADDIFVNVFSTLTVPRHCDTLTARSSARNVMQKGERPKARRDVTPMKMTWSR
jgi:hypothetical protein